MSNFVSNQERSAQTGVVRMVFAQEVSATAIVDTMEMIAVRHYVQQGSTTMNLVKHVLHFVHQALIKINTQELVFHAVLSANSAEMIQILAQDACLLLN